MNIVNLMPHDLTLYAEDRETVIAIFPGVGKEAARIENTPGALTDRGLPVPVAQPATWGAIYNLPEPAPDNVYVVSLLVGQQAQRPDVLAPGTGPNDNAVRSQDGRILGVTRLVAFV